MSIYEVKVTFRNHSDTDTVYRWYQATGRSDALKQAVYDETVDHNEWVIDTVTFSS